MAIKESPESKVYRYVLLNWAVDAGEIVKGTGLDRETVAKMIRKLRRVGLIDGDKVNGVGPIVYQTWYDIENDRDAERKGMEDFHRLIQIPVSDAPAHKGATGPRYTEKQIKAGIAARKRGLGWKAVAEAAGVKSPSYFSRVLRDREPGAR